MDHKKLLTGLTIGSIVGIMSGIEGISGSTFIQAGILYSGVLATQGEAAGTTLMAMVFPISGLAVWEYYKRGQVDIPLACIITLSYLVTAWFGSKLNPMISPKIIYTITGLSLMIATIIFFRKAYIE
jgi:uncharacterized membrane protein YfcA